MLASWSIFQYQHKIIKELLHVRIIVQSLFLVVAIIFFYLKNPHLSLSKRKVWGKDNSYMQYWIY